MRFLHVAVHQESIGAPSLETIQAMLNSASDWIRYGQNCWIVYTAQSAEAWQNILLDIPGMREHASFFVCVFNPKDRAGFVRKAIWDWLDKDRTEAAPAPAPPPPPPLDYSALLRGMMGPQKKP